MNIEDLRKIRIELSKKSKSPLVKDGFPIPSPSSGESEDKYISRCISSIIDEYGQEQASAICYSQWEKK
jgi:hypothetical protein